VIREVQTRGLAGPAAACSTAAFLARGLGADLVVLRADVRAALPLDPDADTPVLHPRRSNTTGDLDGPRVGDGLDPRRLRLAGPAPGPPRGPRRDPGRRGPGRRGPGRRGRDRAHVLVLAAADPDQTGALAFGGRTDTPAPSPKPSWTPTAPPRPADPHTGPKIRHDHPPTSAADKGSRSWWARPPTPTPRSPAGTASSCPSPPPRTPCAHLTARPGSGPRPPRPGTRSPPPGPDTQPATP
jgi:hypothetical protein